MKNRRNKSKDEGDWIVTYSDIVTLLLAFFVLLFSFSEIDAAKWKEIVKSFTNQVVFIEGSSSDSILDDEPNIDINDIMEDLESNEETEVEETEDEEIEDEEIEDEEIEDEEYEEEDNLFFEESEGEEISDPEEIAVIEQKFDELYNKLVEGNTEEGMNLEIIRTPTQIKIRLSNNLLFNPERANINEESTVTLNKIISIVRDYEGVLDKIIMEGNTDNVPIKTDRFRDNFELSLERALQVLYYFKYQGGFEPQKLIPMGYGEYNPIGDNNTNEGRSKNRRTDIVIVKRKYSN